MATAKATETADVFETLRLVDVSEHVEEKDTGKAKLKYLSWAWAWHEVRRRYPNAVYSIIKNENGLPYFVDPVMGIMVYTTVTIGEETHEMWLPVMDGGNNPMKMEPYDIKTKWGNKHVEAATMFDVNKTVMRCLTKNLAMFGIGLALYAGEDLFDDVEGNKGVEATSEAKPKTETRKSVASAATTEELTEIKNKVNAKVQTMVKGMTTAEKDALAARIKEKIGSANYLKCDNASALASLLEDLNKVA